VTDDVRQAAVTNRDLTYHLSPVIVFAECASDLNLVNAQEANEARKKTGSEI
jgi:hypothetical protein